MDSPSIASRPDVTVATTQSRVTPTPAQMNLYDLQIQEAVNAPNRSFTALSNVLEAEHDTVTTAIGNIR